MRDNFLPQFCCDFVSNNCLEDNCFKNNSHLRQNQLKWLLEKSDNYCNHWTYNQTIDLFGLNINSNNLDSNQMKVVFIFVKKTLNELRTDSMTRSGSNRNEINSYRDLRKNVTTFLALLRRRLFEICIQCKPNESQMESKNTFCISVVKQIKGLLLFVGRLSQIKPQLIRLAISSDTKTSIFNYFHCCLDIWWTAIEVMYILDQNNEINLNDLALIRDQICGQQLCSQSIRLVLFDLMVFSVNRFNEMKASNNYKSLSLFDCLCVKEMYVLVRHMFNAINKSVSNDPFFELIFSTLNLLPNSDSHNCYPINDFKTIAFGRHSLEDSSLHFIWFLTAIVQTLNYDISGQSSQPLTSLSIPTPLLRRITHFLRQNELNNNEKLSAVIIFCLKAINFWKPNTDLLLPFTEYFLKNLNKSFYKTTAEELAVIPKTSIKWYQMVREISGHRNNYMENSFYLFLSLMSRHLSSVFKNCEPKTKLMNWQKFKGKLVVNLHSNRLNGLDERAVFNLLSFYLVLMNTNDEIWTDFIDILIETNIRLIDDNSDNNLNNSELILKSMFAVIQTKTISLTEDKISSFLGKIFNNLCEKSIQNSNLRKSFSNLIVIYFDELKILFKSNHFLNSSFDKLLTINFTAISSFYPTLDQQMFVINFISDLMKAIDQNMTQELDTNLILIINTCFDSILPFIKQEITQKNDNQILSDIAFNFTKLSNNSFQTNHQKLCLVFNDFLNISRNNRQFLCSYLSLILQNSELIKQLSKESDICCTLISIWCCLLVSPDVNLSSIDEMTYRLSQIIEDMRSGQTAQNTNSSETFFIFIKNLIKKVSNCEPNSRMFAIQRANKYFKDMIIMSEEVVKNNFSLNSIKRIYALISGLVSIGSQLLYIPSTTDCLLPKMIDSILMPTLSNDLKLKLMPTLQKSFPLFIEGLFKLQFNANEYIERQIRRIISFYLPLYVNHCNPYNILKSELQERNLYSHWTKQLFATIVHNFFNKHESCPISALIPFIKEFCELDLNEEQLIAVFNGALLKIPLTDQRSRESLLSLISSISGLFAKQKKERVLFDNRVLTEFIETNLSNFSNFAKLFEVIDSICKSCPKLFHDFIGQITRTIESIEKKRGIGTDHRLRNALRDFANKNLRSFDL